MSIQKQVRELKCAEAYGKYLVESNKTAKTLIRSTYGGTIEIAYL